MCNPKGGITNTMFLFGSDLSSIVTDASAVIPRVSCTPGFIRGTDTIGSIETEAVRLNLTMEFSAHPRHLFGLTRRIPTSAHVL